MLLPFSMNFSGSRRLDIAEQPHKRCFSCAVCAQQAVDTIGQGNIQIVYGGFGAEIFLSAQSFLIP